jgi:hypothetical protein
MTPNPYQSPNLPSEPGERRPNAARDWVVWIVFVVVMVLSVLALLWPAVGFASD